jgi:hypothetical protein
MRGLFLFLLMGLMAGPLEAWDRRNGNGYHDNGRSTMSRYYDYRYVPRQSIFYSNGTTTYSEQTEYVPVYRPYVPRYQRYHPRPQSKFKRGDNSTRFMQPNHGWRQ